MNSQKSWQEAGGFRTPKAGERPGALKIGIPRFMLYFRIAVFLFAILVAEYVLCGIYFRLARRLDLWILDPVCALAALALSGFPAGGWPRPICFSPS